jgi:N-acetylneuraminic acid mutarotase
MAKAVAFCDGEASVDDLYRKEITPMQGGIGRRIGISSVMGFWVCALAFAQVSGRWSTGAPMPSVRSEVAVAEVGGKVYVVGGFGGDTPLEIYEPTADQWSRGAPIPRPLHHAAAVGVDGRLFVLGGYADGWTPVASVYTYDPATDRWRTRAALPTARGHWQPQ